MPEPPAAAAAAAVDQQSRLGETMMTTATDDQELIKLVGDPGKKEAEKEKWRGEDFCKNWTKEKKDEVEKKILQIYDGKGIWSQVI